MNGTGFIKLFDKTTAVPSPFIASQIYLALNYAIRASRGVPRGRRVSAGDHGEQAPEAPAQPG